MRNKTILALLGVTMFVLAGCSFSMRGVITDVATREPIDQAKISVTISPTRNRDTTTNERGQYRIKKDDKPQEVSFSADGYESFTTSLNKDKTKDVYLIPTPEETAARIVDSMRNYAFDAAYQYMHPLYTGMWSAEDFKKNNENSFAPFLASAASFSIESKSEVATYRDVTLNREFTDVFMVRVKLTFNLSGETSSYYNVYLQKMRDEQDREFYHWLFTQTTNS